MKWNKHQILCLHLIVVTPVRVCLFHGSGSSTVEALFRGTQTVEPAFLPRPLKLQNPWKQAL